MRRMPLPSDVESLLNLFRAEPGDLLLAEDELEADLKAVLRVVLQSHQELQRLGPDPAAALEADKSLHGDIDMLRDDIRSVLESFDRIESVAANLGGVPRVRWPWPEDMSWAATRANFEAGLSRLREENLALWERYVQLVGLIRIEVCFWGRTAGLTANGYIP